MRSIYVSQVIKAGDSCIQLGLANNKTAAVKPKVGKVALGLNMSFKNHNSTKTLFNSIDLKTAAKKNKEVEDPYNSIFATENDEDCHTAVL